MQEVRASHSTFLLTSEVDIDVTNQLRYLNPSLKQSRNELRSEYRSLNWITHLRCRLCEAKTMAIKECCTVQHCSRLHGLHKNSLLIFALKLRVLLSSASHEFIVAIHINFTTGRGIESRRSGPRRKGKKECTFVFAVALLLRLRSLCIGTERYYVACEGNDTAACVTHLSRACHYRQ